MSIIKTGRMLQKSKKEIEKRLHAGYGINLLAKLRAHFYIGNYICLYCASCGAILSFKKSQNGKYSEIRDFIQGDSPLAAQVPIPNKVCNLILQIQTYKVIESVKYKFEG